MMSKGSKRKPAGSRKGKRLTKGSVDSPAKKQPARSLKIGLWEYSLKTSKFKWLTPEKDLICFGQHAPKTISDLVRYLAVGDRRVFKTAFGKAIKKRDDFLLEVRLHNARDQWIEFKASLAADSRGVVNKYIGIFQDVTQRRANELEWANWKIKNDLISESLGLLIYDYNISTSAVKWNGTRGDVLGHPERDVDNIDKWLKLIHPDDRLFTQQEFERARANLSAYDVQYRFRNKQGEYRHIRDRGLFPISGSAEPQRMVGILIDISSHFNALQGLAASEKNLLKTEKRFQRMIEDLTVAIVLLSEDAKVITANRAAHELSILNSDASAISDRLSFISEDGAKISDTKLPWVTAHQKNESIRGMLVGVIYSDEKVSWFIVNADPEISDNVATQILITFTDVTDRKRILEHWQESELRFRTLHEASFGGIGLHRMGLIVDCNQGLCDLSGYRYEELIGMNGLNLIAPEHRDLVIERIVSKSTAPYDVIGIRKDGSRYFLEIHGKNIPYKDGQLRVTEFRDITDRKLAEEKILEQNARLLLITEDLKQKNEQLKEFTQIVSHNLRSPVGNILALLGLIEAARDESELKDALALLKEAGSTTLATLTELNQVLQIQQNRNIPSQTLRFADVFDSVKRLLNGKIAEAGAIINCDFNNAPTVSFPKIYLESVLLNLISNALKYTVAGRRPEIFVKTVTNSDKTISMFVSDNGAGINMDKYGHQVFKLRKTFHKHPESRGIGLFMIKNQLEAMGGRISLTSTEGDGSVFQVDFNQIPDGGK